ncbi:hypothetical protein ABW20_dc0103862 [Dactylellina cionopaga]|nr:hypothetical protein ABW20_dc0103862 [Dactylellina cionopaga]
MTISGIGYSVQDSVGLYRRTYVPANIPCWKGHGLSAAVTMAPSFSWITQIPKEATLPVSSKSSSSSRSSTTTSRLTTTTTRTSSVTTTKSTTRTSSSTSTTSRTTTTSSRAVSTTTSSSAITSTSTTSSSRTTTPSSGNTTPTTTISTSRVPTTTSTSSVTTTSSASSTTSNTSSLSTATTTSQTMTSTTSSPTIATPSATPGNDFDLHLDQQIGYLSPDTDTYYQQLFPGIGLSDDNKSGKRDRILRRMDYLFTEVNHRNMRRFSITGLINKATKYVVAVATAPLQAVLAVVVKLLPPVDATLSFGIPFKFEAPSWLPDGVLRDEDGWTLFKAKIPKTKVDAFKKQHSILQDREYKSKIKFAPDVGAEFGIYCQDCYLDTKFDVSGHIAFDHNGMKVLNLGYGGPMELKLGMALKAEGFYTTTFTRELKKIDLPTFKIPFIVRVGPTVTFSAGWEVDLRGYISIKPTYIFNWKNFGAVITVVGPDQPRSYLPNSANIKSSIEAGANLVTNFFIDIAVTGDVDITGVGSAVAGLYLRGGMGFGITVKQEFEFDKQKRDISSGRTDLQIMKRKKDEKDECNGLALFRQWVFGASIKAKANAKALKLDYTKDHLLFKTTSKLNPSTCFPWSTTKTSVSTSTKSTTSSLSTTSKSTTSSPATITDGASTATTGTSSAASTATGCVPTINPTANKTPSCQTHNGILIHGSDDQWYQVVCGKDFNTADIEVNGLTTLGDCFDRCTAMNKQAGSTVCGGVSFIPGFLSQCSACHLKSATPSSASITRLYAVESIRRVNKPSNNLNCDADTPYSSGVAGLNGGVYQQTCGWYADEESAAPYLLNRLGGTTYSICLDTCTNTSGCKGVSFSSGTCLLLNGLDTNILYQDWDQGMGSIVSIVSNQPMTTKSNVCDGHSPVDKSYFPLENSSKQFFTDCNTQFWLNDYTHFDEIPTLKDCIKLCSQDDRCVAATWYKFTGNTCYLKERWDVRDWNWGQTGGNSLTGSWDSALLSTYTPF